MDDLPDLSGHDREQRHRTLYEWINAAPDRAERMRRKEFAFPFLYGAKMIPVATGELLATNRLSVRPPSEQSIPADDNDNLARAFKKMMKELTDKGLLPLWQPEYTNPSEPDD